MKADGDRVQTRKIQDGGATVARVHGAVAPQDLLCPTSTTWTREEYHRVLADQKARRKPCDES